MYFVSGKTQIENDNSFQPNQLCTQLKIMKALEDDTDYKLKTLKERERSLLEADPDARRENLKVFSIFSIQLFFDLFAIMILRTGSSARK